MAQLQRKSIQELLTMSSAEVRAYLQTLPTLERRMISEELYKAKLSIDIQKPISNIGANNH
jgi:hypothetical protein